MDELSTVAPGKGGAVAQVRATVSSPLLAALLRSGALSSDNAERAERAFAIAGGSLIDVIIKLGLCDEKTLASTVAAECGLSLASVDDIPPEPIRLQSISVPFLRECRVLPLAETDQTVVVAAADPGDPYIAQSLKLAFRKAVSFKVATASLIEAGILRLYSDALAQSTSELNDIVYGDITDSDLERLRESAGEAPIVRFVDRLIARAVDAGASDIHIEPFERQLRVRLRLDGLLVEDEPAPAASAAAIVSRIKIMARLDIAERRLPQDGAIKISVRGRQVDFRVATTPVVHGEEVVIRVLDQTAVQLKLNDLGCSAALQGRLRVALDRPNGVFLVTGPTGSGKSTTLYAALQYLNRTDRKIITVEDPVEFKIDGLNQIQVKPEIGLDFARSLRAILRHDPDVIMVGEIRDAETARIAIQAALTGHVVLSTLHTNDAPSAITRLLNMGIEDYLITSTITGVLAQRLVRTLCLKCSIPARLPDGFISKNGAGASVRTHKGCSACRGTGFSGRTVICEYMEMTSALRQKVLGHTDAAELHRLAIEDGMQTLFDNGMEAVFQGITSYDEILRVAQDMEAGV